MTRPPGLALALPHTPAVGPKPDRIVPAGSPSRTASAARLALSPPHHSAPPAAAFCGGRTEQALLCRRSGDVSPDVISFNIVLRMLCASQRLSAVPALLDLSRLARVPLLATSYAIYMAGSATAGDPQLTMSVWAEMISAQIVPAGAAVSLYLAALFQLVRHLPPPPSQILQMLVAAASCIESCNLLPSAAACGYTSGVRSPSACQCMTRHGVARMQEPLRNRWSSPASCFIVLNNPPTR